MLKIFYDFKIAAYSGDIWCLIVTDQCLSSSIYVVLNRARQFRCHFKNELNVLCVVNSF